MSDNHEARERALGAAHEAASQFLASLPDRPVWPRAGYDEMLAALGGNLPDGGADPEDVVRALAAAADPGLVGIPGGRFFGFVIGGSLPAAVAADWLTSAWDQNAGLTTMTPAASAIETIAGEWLADLLGLPTGSAVGFVTGAMMANFTCLASARGSVLRAVGHDIEKVGLVGAPPLRLVVGEYRHGTIDRAAHFLGIGTDQFVIVPADGEGRMIPAELESALDAGTGPTIVCLQAGEVHTGAFDPFTELIAIAKRHSAWVHIDGAFGLWAAASASTRHLTSGIADADSWCTDAHKTLNVPYDSGLAIVRDPSAMYATFGVHGDYLINAVADPAERTPEFSRRARGFAVYAALRSLGRNGVDALVAGLCANARSIADGLAAIDGVEVINDVVFTQVVATFGDEAATKSLGERLLADGAAVMTPGVWAGRAVQRCSMSGWATTPADVELTLAAVRRLLAQHPS